MNEQEAIETILYASAFNREDSPLTQALDMAIKALEKQIPKKVIYHDNCGNKTPYQPRCPRCYEAINEPYYMNGESWCPYCGQHIDWTVEE